jgi:hypothetical protein
MGQDCVEHVVNYLPPKRLNPQQPKKKNISSDTGTRMNIMTKASQIQKKVRALA